MRACGGDAFVTGITHFAGAVQPGFVFVAIVGQRADGHDFVHEAINRGASGIVSTRQVTLPPHIVWAVVEDGRLALAELAARFFGYPSKRLRVIGVTGTNGKTTTSYLLKNILRQAGRSVGLIGTVQIEVGDRVLPVKFTTPEAPELQGLLRDMADMGASHAVMEVSSHALAMQRVAGVDYSTAVFTNLTQDHLDFHGTMENYFQAKARLFTVPAGITQGTAVINIDDVYGQRLATLSSGQVLRFGLANAAEVTATVIRSSASGSTFALHTPWGEREVTIVTPGAHSVYNALAAAGASLAEGASLEDVERGLSLPGVPGRMEPINEGQPFAVLVDYAHSPDGLENVLRAVKGFAKGRIILVFGCGGDRDRGKRPLMGAIAARFADLVVVTSDNPRSEDPLAIVADILAGFAKADEHRIKIEPERRKAIALALSLADRGDVVLIAGKGHETTQVTREGVFHFDDREEARNALRGRLP
ncbi:MAG: UDP-N-acetylmuramoyl-L-alanyl-D-glutamate--2,6-diaminopimelate ligase [Firmicutes bacterium]|nr:UDP-N-acetylmuramoyl-L-alanyl-D-glutamate--2,6-diaminopimelate ligase [Bacillota bacterium]